MKKSFWPAWFPYPVSWLRAIALLLLSIPLGYGVDFLSRTGRLLSVATNNMGFAMLLVLIALISPFVFLAYAHHLVINKGKVQPGWPARLPSSQSIWEGFLGFNIFTLSFLITACGLMFFVDPRRSPSLSDTAAGIAGSTWVTLMAYFYHAEYLIRHFTPTKPATTPTAASNPKPVTPPPPPSAPTDDTDAELERLRKELGLL